MRTRRLLLRRGGSWATALLFAIGCATAGAAKAADSAQDAAPAEQSIARTAWGTPDISGVWRFVNAYMGAASEDLKYGFGAGDLKQLSAVGNRKMPVWPKGGLVHDGTADQEPPYLPWAQAKRDDILRNSGTADRPGQNAGGNPIGVQYLSPGGRCLLYGVPHEMYRNAPHVYQFKDHILIQWEYPQMDRIIWMDGRSPPDPAIRLWNGFSVGHWDGDTLTVTTTNQNGLPWLDETGDLYGQDTRTTETMKVLGSEIDYKVVLSDPSIYAHPWWMEWSYKVNKFKPSDEILEVACVEGDRQIDLDSVVPPKGKKIVVPQWEHASLEPK